jgi:hypothetical protein
MVQRQRGADQLTGVIFTVLHSGETADAWRVRSGAWRGADHVEKAEANSRAADHADPADAAGDRRSAAERSPDGPRNVLMAGGTEKAGGGGVGVHADADRGDAGDRGAGPSHPASGRRGPLDAGPLLGEQRASIIHSLTTAFDPSRTLRFARLEF